MCDFCDIRCNKEIHRARREIVSIITVQAHVRTFWRYHELFIYTEDPGTRGEGINVPKSSPVIRHS